MYESLIYLCAYIYTLTTKAMKRQKVTAGDLRSIKLGETRVFYVPTPKDVRSAQSRAHTITKVEPELGVKFETSASYEDRIITITAVKR